MEKALACFDFSSKNAVSIETYHVESMIKWLWKLIGKMDYRALLGKIYFDFDVRCLVATDGRMLGIYHLPEKCFLDDIEKSCYLKICGKTIVAIEIKDKYPDYKRIIPDETKMTRGLILMEEDGLKKPVNFFELYDHNFDFSIPRLYKALPFIVSFFYIQKLKGFTVEFFYTPHEGRVVKFVEEKKSCNRLGYIEAIVAPMRMEFHSESPNEFES